MLRVRALHEGLPGGAGALGLLGRVAYADEYPEYGKTVLLDHGDGYFTVTAGLGSIEVRVGEDLPAGARLGLCGNAGTQGRIYFEVRQGTETLHPGEWFGI